MVKWIVLVLVVVLGVGVSFAYVNKKRKDAEALARFAEEDNARIADLHRAEQAEAARQAELAALRKEEAKPRLNYAARRKADAQFDAAEKLLEDGNVVAAEAAYRRLCIASASDALALSRWGLTLELGGDPGTANDDYARALTIDATCADAHANKAALNFDKAPSVTKELDLAIQLDPACIRAYEARAVDRFMHDQDPGGIADCETILKIADRDAKGAMRLDANGVNALIIRGTMFLLAGKDDDALAMYNEAVKSGPGNLLGYWNRGHVLYDRGSWKEAASDFAKVYDLDPKSIYVDDAQLLLWLSRARSGEAEAASANLASFAVQREAALPPGSWRPKLARFLSGTLTDADLLKAADEGPFDERPYQGCQANFYAGSKKIVAGDAATAKTYLEACLATRQTNTFEYRSARAELARLAKK
jgi:lipoprotein NlpI